MTERTLPRGAMSSVDGDNAAAGRERLVRSFFSGTGSIYDRTVKIFTLGQDNNWKNEIVKLVPEPNRILDLGGGTGILTERLASRYPDAEIVGVDITPDYLAAYDERLRANPWINARSILGNAETVALDGEFDAVVSSYLAKYVDPDTLLRNIVPHLRRGGVFIAHDFTLPTNPLYLASWQAYTWMMNRVGPLLFPEWHTVFAEGLTDLIRSTHWVETFMEVLRNYEFRGIQNRKLTFETAGLVWATKS